MLIRKKKNWELPEAAVTSERIYRERNRRDFLKTLGLGLAGATLLGSKDLYAATAGFPCKENEHYPASALKPTPYNLITSYNNFYEFDTDKSDPKDNASKGWKAEPWTVELTGLVKNPGKFDVNDLVKKIGGLEQRVYRRMAICRGPAARRGQSRTRLHRSWNLRQTAAESERRAAAPSYTVEVRLQRNQVDRHLGVYGCGSAQHLECNGLKRVWLLRKRESPR